MDSPSQTYMKWPLGKTRSTRYILSSVHFQKMPKNSELLFGENYPLGVTLQNQNKNKNIACRTRVLWFFGFFGVFSEEKSLKNDGC